MTAAVTPRYYYVDYNGAVQSQERDCSISAYFFRTICQLLHIRNYSLSAVIHKYSAHPETTIIDRETIALYTKTIGRLLITEKDAYFIEQAKIAIDAPSRFVDTEWGKLNTYADRLLTDKKKQKMLRKYQQLLPKDCDTYKAIEYLLCKGRVREKMAELGLQDDHYLVDSFFYDFKFLFDTQLMYAIIGHKNSTADGSTNHGYQVENDQLCIKKEGRWTPAEEIRGQLRWNKKEKALYQITNVEGEEVEERWCYLSPSGLVPINFYISETLPACEKLSQEEVAKLRAHAALFNPEIQTDYFFQLTHIPFVLPEQLPEALKNTFAHIPDHVWIRLIDGKTGEVFCTGLVTNPIDNENVIRVLSSCNGFPTLIDTREFSKHKGKIVTTIPVQEENFAKALQCCSQSRKEIVRFNLMRQNCTKFAISILKIVSGETIQIDNEFTFTHFLYLATPNIPVLSQLRIATKPLRDRISKIYNEKMPRFIQNIFWFIAEVILFIPKIIRNVSFNCLFLALGAKKGTPVQELQPEEEPNEGLPRFQRFKSMMDSIFDIFREKTHHLCHSTPVVQWMLQQQSTYVHLYHNQQPAMGIVPDSDPEIAIRSEERKKYYQNVYLESCGIPVQPAQM